MLNWIWLGLILGSIVWASFTGHMGEMTSALIDGSKQAIDLVIGLVGGMVFMLGIMRVAFDAGLRDWIARALAPLMRRLFPEVPADHPAMGAMVMNLASNILGLGNAATPFGLKAMSELAKLNRGSRSASDAMVLFLAINTSAITILPPSGTIMVRAAANSSSPEAIWIPTLIATSCSTLAAVAMFFLLRRLPIFQPQEGEEESRSEETVADSPESAEADPLELGPPAASRGPMELWRRGLLLAIGLALLAAFSVEGIRVAGERGALAVIRDLLPVWSFPLLIAALLMIGIAGRINVYDSMIEGAKEGLEVAVRIVPYLVAIIAAVAMFRASGLLDLLVAAASPMTQAVGVPAEVLPMAILRPLSASGAFAVMSETLTAYGPDSFIGLLTSTLQGSTETTFYVLAVYFGAARVTQGRHTLAACLTGDAAGFVGAVAACHLFFG